LLPKNLKPEIYKSVFSNKNLSIVEPVSFLEIIVLEKHAKLVLTDSGGVQKESFFFKKPCIILRPETEWKELVECGAAIIADADYNRILDSYNHFAKQKGMNFPPIFGDGKASEFICSKIVENFGTK
jgi:UDP-GlcNAc3NAcA epimerase